MTHFSLKKKIKFTTFAERRNQHSCKNASTADLTRARMLQLQTSRAQRKTIYCRPHSCKNASTSRARTGRHSHEHPGQRGWASRTCGSEQIWSTDGMQEELSCLIYNQTWTLVDFRPGRKGRRCGWINKAKKNEHVAVYRLKSRRVAKAHSQKDIPRYQESTIMTLLHLLETKLFSDSSSLLPCILDTNFTSWTSTLPIYMGTFHLWPQKIGKRMVLSNPKFSEIHWIRNLSKRIMLAG